MKTQKPKPKPVPVAAPKSVAYVLPPDRVLVLRACNADMKSHGGFVWPRSGQVEARDFRPTSACGNGLHGWLWASGDINASSGHGGSMSEPIALRLAADMLTRTSDRYDGGGTAHDLVRTVLRREARNLRSIATREERRRAGR